MAPAQAAIGRHQYQYRGDQCDPRQYAETPIQAGPVLPQRDRVLDNKGSVTTCDLNAATGGRTQPGEKLVADENADRETSHRSPAPMAIRESEAEVRGTFAKGVGSGIARILAAGRQWRLASTMTKRRVNLTGPFVALSVTYRQPAHLPFLPQTTFGGE